MNDSPRLTLDFLEHEIHESDKLAESDAMGDVIMRDIGCTGTAKDTDSIVFPNSAWF